MKNKNRLIYEGKAKKIFSGPNKNTYIQFFKDSATAFNNKKKATVKNKGIINNLISAHIFSYLNKNSVQTHFIRRISDREQLIKKVKIIPLEVVIRNIAAGSIAEKFNITEGTRLPKTIIEYYYKCDKLNDPFVNKNHIIAFKWANELELRSIEIQANKINILLKKMFNKVSINLIDFKIEFGRLNRNNIVLADEISPDSCRLWDKTTKKKLDKDVFRRNIGDLEEVYNELLDRLGLNKI